LDLLLPFGPSVKWPLAGIIYPRLFRYTQQYTACLQSTALVPARPKTGPGYTNIYNINTRYENIWQVWAVDPILTIAMIVLNNHIIYTEDKYKIEDFERTSWRLFHFERTSWRLFHFERTSWRLFHKRFMRTKLDIYVFF
jgi:hypothetical protein